MCYNAKRGENMKLAIDAMSGDLGSSIVVEACQSFLNKNKTDELYVVGKIEELEALKDHPQVTLIDAREIFEMTENILAIRRKKESSLVKAMMLARNNEVDAVLSCGKIHRSLCDRPRKFFGNMVSTAQDSVRHAFIFCRWITRTV